MQSSGLEFGGFYQTRGHPFVLLCRCLCVLCQYQEGAKGGIRVTVCPHPALGSALVHQRLGGLRTACEPALLVNHFAFCSAIFKLDHPAHQAAAQTLPVTNVRGRNQSAAGWRERNWELHQPALLFKGLLHFEANQPLNSNSSLAITACWLFSLAQACGNWDLGRSIKAKEEKSLQLLQS